MDEPLDHEAELAELFECDISPARLDYPFEDRGPAQWEQMCRAIDMMRGEHQLDMDIVKMQTKSMNKMRAYAKILEANLESFREYAKLNQLPMMWLTVSEEPETNSVTDETDLHCG